MSIFTPFWSSESFSYKQMTAEEMWVKEKSVTSSSPPPYFAVMVLDLYPITNWWPHADSNIYAGLFTHDTPDWQGQGLHLLTIYGIYGTSHSVVWGPLAAILTPTLLTFTTGFATLTMETSSGQSAELPWAPPGSNPTVAYSIQTGQSLS